MQALKVLLVVLLVVNLSSGFFFQKKKVYVYQGPPAPAYGYTAPVHYQPPPPVHHYSYPKQTVDPGYASYYHQPAPYPASGVPVSAPAPVHGPPAPSPVPSDSVLPHPAPVVSVPASVPSYQAPPPAPLPAAPVFSHSASVASVPASVPSYQSPPPAPLPAAPVFSSPVPVPSVPASVPSFQAPSPAPQPTVSVLSNSAAVASVPASVPSYQSPPPAPLPAAPVFSAPAPVASVPASVPSFQAPPPAPLPAPSVFSAPAPVASVPASVPSFQAPPPAPLPAAPVFSPPAPVHSQVMYVSAPAPVLQAAPLPAALPVPSSNRIPVHAPVFRSNFQPQVVPKPLTVAAPLVQTTLNFEPQSYGGSTAHAVQGLPVFEAATFQGGQHAVPLQEESFSVVPSIGSELLPAQVVRSQANALNAANSFEIVPSFGYQSGSSTDFIEIVKSQGSYIELPAETVQINDGSVNSGSSSVDYSGSDTVLAAPSPDQSWYRSLDGVGVDAHSNSGSTTSTLTEASHDALQDSVVQQDFSDSTSNPLPDAPLNVASPQDNGAYVQDTGAYAQDDYAPAVPDSAPAVQTDDFVNQWSLNQADDSGPVTANDVAQPDTTVVNVGESVNTADVPSTFINQNVIPTSSSELDSDGFDPINFPEVQELLSELVNGRRDEDTRRKKDVASSGNLRVYKSVEIDPRVSYSKVARQ